VTEKFPCAGEHGLFKPIAGTSNRLQVKILQNSHPKNVQSRVKEEDLLGYLKQMLAISPNQV